MGPCAPRRLVGAVVVAATLTGCGSSNPLITHLDHGASSSERATRSTGQPSIPTDTRTSDSAPAHRAELGSGATREDYLRYAALNNPGLEAKFQEWIAAVERVPQVGALPDSRFTYGYYVGSVETRVGPMQHTFSLSQTLPWLGKLRDREDAAARRANAAYARFEAARLDLFYRVEEALNQLYFLKQSIDITRDTIELLEQFERVAQTRYRVGETAHPDLLKLQVELGVMEDRLGRLHDLREPYAARLNAALGRDVHADTPWPTTISERVVESTDRQLLAMLQERSPELHALHEELESERLGVRIARDESVPDLTIGLAYTVIGHRGDVDLAGNGDDALLATASINLPLWREKYDAATREAMARRQAAAARRGESLSSLSSSLQEALFEHEDAKRRVELYRDSLVPKATESLGAALGSFTQGQSDFLDLIEAQRTMLEFQLAFERALVDRATSYARIEQLVGAPLSELAETTHAEGPES